MTVRHGEAPDIAAVRRALESKLDLLRGARGKQDRRPGADLLRPTLVGTLYGMNFENVPELACELGYPLALALMALPAVALQRAT